MGQMISYSRPDGNEAPGYYAQPEKNGESAPGIVVIEEWWGLTPQIMEIVDRYATLGYRALAPDLFRGRTAAVGDEASHLTEGLDFEDAVSEDVRGAVMHLKERSPKAGVTGYCIGGALALLAAMRVKEADAAVIFYGLPPPEAGDPATIEIPILCHFAKDDEFFPPSRAAEVIQRLEDGKVPHEVYWYDAKHGFSNPNPPGNAGLGHYNPQAAHLAWERTVTFWQHALSS